MSVLAAFAVPHPPIILPEVGRGEERQIRKTTEAYRDAMRQAAALRPETIVLTSPHTVMYADYFHVSPGRGAEGDFSRFGAPQVRLHAEYDTEFVSALSEICGEQSVPAGTFGEREKDLDHASMIPLRFLNECYGQYRVVRIGLSGLPPLMHYRLGQCIAAAAGKLQRRVVLIASGDLSHKLKKDGPYGFAPEGPEFDRAATEALENGDFLKLLSLDPDFCEAAAECGLRSFWIMAGALDRKAVKTNLLSYEGPFGVGYGVASFEVEGKDEARNFGEQLEVARKRERSERRDAEDPLVRLARLSLETYVKTGKFAELPANLPEEIMGKRAGAFVSLKKDGVLRGCIGTIEAVRNSLAEEILCNAVSAGENDPRFSPVTEEELPELVYSVDVLSEPEPADSSEQLNPTRYGFIVQNGTRRGLLLPDLAGIDTPEEQIAIARRKAGIGRDEPVRLWRFEVVRHR